jgi:hypothetical protein
MASISGLSNNTEIVEKKIDIEQALSRARRPLDSTVVNLEVYGVYSLPDSWKSKIVTCLIILFQNYNFK